MYGVGIEKYIQNGRGKKSREINTCMGIYGNIILQKDPKLAIYRCPAWSWESITAIETLTRTTDKRSLTVVLHRLQMSIQNRLDKNTR